jgi:solute:Na+ symporter, SSS family
VIENIKVLHHENVPNAPPWWLLASLVFMTSFGTWGLPQMIHKFYAISDERQITRAAVVTTVFALVVGMAAYFTGSMTHIFYKELPPGANPFDVLVPNLLTTYLPQSLLAVIVVLILSASMSTLSSLVLVSSSAVAIDMYKGHVNPEISTKNSLAMMRLLSGVFVVISYLIARYEFAFIVTLMSLSWGAIAGSFLAPYLLGLYWRRVTRTGVYAGMFTGLGIVIGGFLYLGDGYGKLSPVVASIAMIVPFFVVPVVSLMTSPPLKETLDIAFEKIGRTR